MSYILINPAQNLFVQVTKNNGVKKVSRKDKATIFPTVQKANQILHHAPGKLKNWTVMKIEETKDQNINSTKTRIPISSNVKHEIYMNQKGLCAYCGEYAMESDMTIDHILPLSKGGSNDPDNLQCTCNECNQLKGNRLHNDFLEQVIKITKYQQKITKDQNTISNNKEFNLPLLLPNLHFINNTEDCNYTNQNQNFLMTEIILASLYYILLFLAIGFFFCKQIILGLFSVFGWGVCACYLYKSYKDQKQLLNTNKLQNTKKTNIFDGTLILNQDQLYIQLLNNKNLILVKNIHVNPLIQYPIYDTQSQTLTIQSNIN